MHGTRFQADFAIVKAWKGDEAGNLVLTARNFNPCMAEQQKITIAEVEELPRWKFRSK
jgi:3-oxoacid CoA-transferase subunit A